MSEYNRWYPHIGVKRTEHTLLNILTGLWLSVKILELQIFVRLIPIENDYITQLSRTKISDSKPNTFISNGMVMQNCSFESLPSHVLTV